jgi:hypothetical protein
MSEEIRPERRDIAPMPPDRQPRRAAKRNAAGVVAIAVPIDARESGRIIRLKGVPGVDGAA